MGIQGLQCNLCVNASVNTEWGYKVRGYRGFIDMGIQVLQVIQTMCTEAFTQRLHCIPCIPTSITPVTPNFVPPLSVH